MLSWLGGKELTTRVSSISTESRTEISGGMRSSIDRDTIHMFRNKPVLGWGLGTFPVVYPQFRSFYTNFFVNEAHNDYLQLLAEMGLLGFGTMVWFLIVLYRNGNAQDRNWMSDVSGAVTLACIWGVAESSFTASSTSTCRFPPTRLSSTCSARSPPHRRCCSARANADR